MAPPHPSTSSNNMAATMIDGPGEVASDTEIESREGSIERGDEPIAISSSCKIRNVIYHMVTFK